MEKRRYNRGIKRKNNNSIRYLLLLFVFSTAQNRVNGLYTSNKISQKFGSIPWYESSSTKTFGSSSNRFIGSKREQLYGKSSTSLRMVLTIPDTIIEQASTQKLVDDLIDESVRTIPRKPVMMQFDPTSSSIWRRWRGTVFSETWAECLKNMAFAFVLYSVPKLIPQLKENLQGFQILWGQLLSVTTFTLTFFLNQSYILWRKCYSLSRRLQGRLNDLGLTLAAHASRTTPSNPLQPSTYTAGSRQLLELIARYIRLFNILCYASFTRSHRPILTPKGMRRLVERGLLTPEEKDILVNAKIPATQRHNAVIMWIVRCFLDGRNAGHFVGGSGFEQQFMEKVHVIRAVYGGVGDELQGRMPLAYTHIVQVLVDIIIWLYPLMAFATDMTPFLGILGTGLLTLTYQGLFDLAKQFLDPYDNETYGKGDDPICVDTLVAESNSGSIRWLNGFNEMPVSEQRIKSGELLDYQLPLRGYSIEDLAKMEKDKIEKELEERKKQDREAAEQLAKRAEDERLKKLDEISNSTTSETISALNHTSSSANATLDLTVESSETFMAGNKISVQEEPINNVTAKEVDDAIEKGPKVHRVLSLGDGRPFTYRKESIPQPTELASQPTELTSQPTELTSQSKELASQPTESVSQPFESASPPTESVPKPTESVPQSNDILQKIYTTLGSQYTNEAKPINLEDDIAELVGPIDTDSQPFISQAVRVEGGIQDQIGITDSTISLEQNHELSESMSTNENDARINQESSDEDRVMPIPPTIDAPLPLTLEDYSQKLNEVSENLQKELKETEAILNASPGADSDETEPEEESSDEEDVKEANETPEKAVDASSVIQAEAQAAYEAVKEEEERVEQRLETISASQQPESASQPTESVSQPTESASQPTESASQSTESVPQSTESASQPIELSSQPNETVRIKGGIQDQIEITDSTILIEQSYELSESMSTDDEYSSQQPADEDSETSKPPIVDAPLPLTLEDYSQKLNEVSENLQKELKETEAILNARPGADSYETVPEEDSSDEEDGKEANEKTPEKFKEKSKDPSSVIRAEAQAAYEAAKEEEERVEQQLEMRSKNDGSLAILFDEEEEPIIMDSIITPVSEGSDEKSTSETESLESINFEEDAVDS